MTHSGNRPYTANGANRRLVIQMWTGAEAKQLRQALRLSIEAFAARLGLSPRGGGEVGSSRRDPDTETGDAGDAGHGAGSGGWG